MVPARRDYSAGGGYYEEDFGQVLGDLDHIYSFGNFVSNCSEEFSYCVAVCDRFLCVIRAQSKVFQALVKLNE
jgi:hypothetical protein